MVAAAYRYPLIQRIHHAHRATRCAPDNGRLLAFRNSNGLVQRRGVAHRRLEDRLHLRSRALPGHAGAHRGEAGRHRAARLVGQATRASATPTASRSGSRASSRVTRRADQSSSRERRASQARVARTPAVPLASRHAIRAPATNITICKPAAGSFLDDVLAGLSAPRKTLPPKYFYDERGSRAVRRDLRAARVLPHAHRARDARGVARATWRARIGPRRARSSSTAAARAARRASCIEARAAASPTSRSTSPASSCATPSARSPRRFPSVRMVAVCADYTQPLALPTLDGSRRRRRVVYFPGLDHRQFHRARGARFPAQRARGRRRGRRDARRRRSEEGPRAAARGVQRCAGRHRALSI